MSDAYFSAESTHENADKLQKDLLAWRAPILGKWLWILFWLIIPLILGAILSCIERVRGIYLAGQILSAAASVTAGVIYLKLHTVNRRYRTAGICALITALADLFSKLLSSDTKDVAARILLLLPLTVITLVGLYNEYTAHSDVIIGVDNPMSEKWMTLCKLHMGSMIAILTSILFALLIPVLGALLLLGGEIGLLVAYVLRFVYLHRSALAFQDYFPEDAED